MHRSLVAALVLPVTLASVPASAAPKESRDGKVTRHRTIAPTQKPMTRPHQATSCAQFGAGFMRLPGSDSCVRFNGGVGMGVGAVP